MLTTLTDIKTLRSCLDEISIVDKEKDEFMLDILSKGISYVSNITEKEAYILMSKLSLLGLKVEEIRVGSITTAKYSILEVRL